MQLMLRPPQPRFHPLMRHWGSRQRGFAGLGQSNLNVTTFWTPQGGYINPVDGGAAPAVYVAPNLIPTPACASGPAATADSEECQRQVAAAQQQNFALRSSANYDVDRANCENAWATNAARYTELGLPVPPNTCGQQTFGLTLPGGSSGSTVALMPNAPQIFDPSYSGPVAGPVSGGGPGPGAGGAPQFSFTNLTSGDNANFKVGDRWQIQITGVAPNSPVTVNGGQNGANVTSQMGTTDSSGRFSLNGQMDQSQIGNWQEAWQVGSQNVASFRFTVSPGTGTGGGPLQTTQLSTLKSVFGTLPGGSVSIGGTDIPWVVIGGAALVVVLLMRGK